MSANELYEEGKQLYNGGFYDSSVLILERAKFLYFDNENSLGSIKVDYAIGENYSNIGDCEKAIKLITDALKKSENKFGVKHPLTADGYYYLSRAYGGCGRQYDKAIGLLDESIRLKTEIYGEKSQEVAFDYSYMGYCLNSKGVYDSAKYYLEYALKIREANKSDQVELSHTLHLLAQVYESKDDLKKGLEMNIEALRLRKMQLNNNHPTISNSLNSIGSIYRKYGNFDQALSYYLEALEIRKNALGENHPNVAASYYTIGNLYGNMSNYHRAVQYLEQGNRIYLEAFGEKSAILHTYYAYLGRMHGKLHNYLEAEKTLQQAKFLSEKYVGENHPYRAVVYNILGDYYADRKNNSLQSEYHNKALNIYRIVYGDESVREADVLVKLSSMEFSELEDDTGLAYLERAQEIYKKNIGIKNSKLGKLYQIKGDISAERSEYSKAILNYFMAIGAISIVDSLLTAKLPKIEALNNKPLAFKISQKIAFTYYQQYKRTDNLELLKLSLITYKYSIDLIDEVISGYTIELSKSQLQSDSRLVYEQAMNIAYILYKVTHDNYYKYEAFSITEKSKSALLLTNTRDVEAKHFAGVPDSLLEKERDLKIELTYIEKHLRDIKSSKNKGRISLYQKTLFDTQDDFEKLKRLLQNQFPAYYNYKFNQNILSMEKVKNELETNSAIIEYFETDTSLFIFTISDTIFEFSKHTIDSAFYQSVESYQRSITDHDLIVNDPQLADSLYVYSAAHLYKVLLHHSDTILSLIDKLIIIPDNRLSQINFATFLTQPVSATKIQYADLEYLLKKYTINYAYSTTWKYSLPETTADYSFGGFAPSYKVQEYDDVDSLSHPMTYVLVRDGKLPLPGAISEVSAISEMMDGQPWVGKNASETNFKKNASNYNIIHLAMHSLLNSEEPGYSELLFNNEKDLLNDGYLYVNEIYNLDLNAELVVLSACSSGSGKVQVGEGPISLSRAFSYAGCPSVVMSMWKIPDEATRNIMIAFYENLIVGQSKDEALKNAQLQYLKETDDPLHKHPFYWASFVAMGNTEPIKSKPTNRDWASSILYILLIILILFMITKKIASKTSQ